MNPRSVDARPPVHATAGVTWKLHCEIVLLAGWGRAILLQLAHPLVARGVAEHSGFLTEGWGRLARLRRTLSAMLTLTFGTREEVERVARAINAIHDRVHSELPTPHDAFPERARYTAHDPRLLAWVHATLVDSFLRTYELFVSPLGPEERDRYCAESSAIEPLLGIPAGSLPRSVAELRAYMDGMLASGEIVVTDTARRLAREVVYPPGLAVGWPLLALARLPTVGLLPASIRRQYGFPWDTRRERALVVVAAIARRLLPLLPSVLRHWPAARAARRRERAAGRDQPAPGVRSSR
ncbi:MAG TPA: oxygenase MpaB family protein [Methylomirabilota bacterium]|jgi:uncharacterized protein (DUF2236 family)|nr:oxygenase MpaB family protein [Methylomirabilota bacterium]